MTHSTAARGLATGGMVLAATLMLLAGLYHIILGIAAIGRAALFVATPHYVVTVSTTTWGWVHLVLGVLVLIAGICLYTGATWARVIGVVMATLSALDNFFFVPRYPIWSLVIIALDVFVIWALVTAPPVSSTEG